MGAGGGTSEPASIPVKELERARDVPHGIKISVSLCTWALSEHQRVRSCIVCWHFEVG